MVAQQCRVLFVLPTLKWNISALLVLSDAEQTRIGNGTRKAYFFNHIIDFRGEPAMTLLDCEFFSKKLKVTKLRVRQNTIFGF